MNKRLALLSAAVCACVVAATPIAFAQSSAGNSGRISHWKWRDAQGRIQFSDRPPPASVPARDILAKPTPFKATEFLSQAQQATSAPERAASAPAGKASGAEDAATAQRRKEVEAQNQRIRAENCQRARTQLSFMESGGVVTRVNAQGEREVLEDALRNAELQRLRQAVQTECR